MKREWRKRKRKKSSCNVETLTKERSTLGHWWELPKKEHIFHGHFTYSSQLLLLPDLSIKHQSFGGFFTHLGEFFMKRRVLSRPGINSLVHERELLIPFWDFLSPSHLSSLCFLFPSHHLRSQKFPTVQLFLDFLTISNTSWRSRKGFPELPERWKLPKDCQMMDQ